MARTILVADDSPTIRRIVELTFSESEIQVETARTGREAIDRLERVQPDLVLVDVVMPDLSGYDLCRTIKASGNPVPVLLLAGTFEPYDSELAHECGADAHLVKPFESETLRQKVRLLLEPPAVEPVVPIDEGDPSELTDEPADPVADAGGADTSVSPELVEAVASAVVRRLSTEVLREVAMEVVPRLATEIIRERIRELEEQELEEDRESGER